VASELLFLGPPLAMTTLAVCGRRWGRWAYWGSACALAIGLSALWYRIANVGQPRAAPAFVVLLPVAATFWVVSVKALVRRPAWATIAGLAAGIGATLIGVILGVNLGMLRP